MGLKAYLEKIEPNFEPGGKHEKWYALYEAAATIFYTPGKVNKATRTCVTALTLSAS